MPALEEGNFSQLTIQNLIRNKSNDVIAINVTTAYIKTNTNFKLPYY